MTAPAMPSSALVWFRRDLRCLDHAALSAALRECEVVHCVFIFDREILDLLPDKADRRVEFIWESVRELGQALAALGGELIVQHAVARDAIPALARALKVNAVYANHDYEPHAIARDLAVKKALNTCGADLHTFKDQVIFEKSEILTQASGTFSVFTPYKNAWLKKVTPQTFNAHSITRFKTKSAPQVKAMPSLESMGFARTNLSALKIAPGALGADALLADFANRIDHYDEARNFPAIKGPSYLSVHLRFGTISIRKLAGLAYERWKSLDRDGAAVWLSELIWRDFYFQILHHHPHVVGGAFKPAYDKLNWRNDPVQFKAWCDGETGFPIVDAAMRQLNQTGYMHNRLRMIVASFLTKDLQIDWRWGEKYFAEKLIDFDLAANNGGWQWAASTGCDAQPYFRIFNPQSQSEKFDEKGQFIRRYVPEIAGLADKYIHTPAAAPAMLLDAAAIALGKSYPRPIVDHATAREMTLAMYKAARG